jgi:hypothetical protein
VEQTLGLIAGGGEFPGRVAVEAARQGWRVVAFSFAGSPDLRGKVQRVIPCHVAAIGEILETLRAEGVGSVVFSGKLDKRSLFGEVPRDAGARRFLDVAGGLSDEGLVTAVVATLTSLGIEILDQRSFLGALFAPPGPLTARSPSDTEAKDIAFGLRLARRCAEYGIGQTVVMARGVPVAVEAVEGTSETIRRGCALAGPGVVVVKAVAPQQDYRFDVPAVGLATVEVMARGQARVLAVEAGAVAVVDRESVVALADDSGIAIVGVGA